MYIIPMDNTRRLIENKLKEVFFTKQYANTDNNIYNTGIRNLVDGSTLDRDGAITDQLLFQIYEID